MSKMNRKNVYAKLVADGRVKDISEALLKEFGVPRKAQSFKAEDKK